MGCANNSCNSMFSQLSFAKHHFSIQIQLFNICGVNNGRVESVHIQSLVENQLKSCYLSQWQVTVCPLLKCGLIRVLIQGRISKLYCRISVISVNNMGGIQKRDGTDTVVVFPYLNFNTLVSWQRSSMQFIQLHSV